MRLLCGHTYPSEQKWMHLYKTVSILSNRLKLVEIAVKLSLCAWKKISSLLATFSSSLKFSLLAAWMDLCSLEFL